jgi:hypothetical protein
MDDTKRTIIDQAQQQRMVKDTVILQKVNAAHREAFKQRFPGQVDHILRLTAERLHAMLLEKPQDLGNPETWTATAQEIESLSNALHNIFLVHKEVKDGFQSIPTYKE